MRIAVAAEGNQVSQHFGHCDGFIIYDAEAGTILGKTFLPNPGHQPGLLPRLVREAGAAAVIAGGMGGGAIELFNDAGIQVITGAAGDALQTVKDYMAGKLASDGSTCHEHAHSGDCGGHT